jgi:hypothetical protein
MHVCLNIKPNFDHFLSNPGSRRILPGVGDGRGPWRIPSRYCQTG